MKVSDAIRTLHAVRRFTDRPIAEEDIRAILNAGRRAQSSKNSQPWTFIAIRDRETLQRLSECGTYAGHLADAALAVALVSAEKTDFDLGQAAAFMELAAWERGIGSCLAAMWEPDKAKGVLGIPAEQHFWIAISFGYPADEQRPGIAKGGRRPLADVVHWDRWS